MDTELRQEEIRKLDHELDLTKTGVFRRPDAAFFAPLMCGLDFSWDSSIETASSNSKQLLWSPADFRRCRAGNQGEDLSTLMHELWHVARLHDLRRGSRCPDVWNIACDIWINRELQKSKYFIGSTWVLRPQYDHINLEEDIYEELQKNGGGGGAKPCSHGQAPSTSSPQAQIATVVKAVNAAKIAGQPGSIPGNTEQILDKFLAPIIPWEQHLIQWMTDLADEDFTWARPNRRHGGRIYLPSRFTDEGRLEHLIYFQDVSGSVSDKDILRFNSELKYVWDEMKPQKMTVAQFDTKIQKVDEYKEGQPFTKIVIKGRGGTSLVPVRAMIEELKPTAAIIFSDMQVAPMAKVDIPVLWVAVDGGYGVGHYPSFGKTITIKS
jgi:predicted metal-dependent peptidase